MRITLKDIELIRDARNAVASGLPGLTVQEKDGETCLRLFNAGLLEYVGDQEVLNKGISTGQCVARFSPTPDGLTLLKDYYGGTLI